MQLVSKTQLPRIKHRTAALVYFFISGFGYSTWASRIPAIQQQLHLEQSPRSLEEERKAALARGDMDTVRVLNARIRKTRLQGETSR